MVIGILESKMTIRNGYHILMAQNGLSIHGFIINSGGMAATKISNLNRAINQHLYATLLIRDRG